MLTQPQLQSLKSELKAQIHALEYDISDLKEFIKDVYEKADPEDKVNGEFYFHVLNRNRSTYRHLKKRLKTLVNLQKSIKNSLAGEPKDQSFAITGEFTIR